MKISLDVSSRRPKGCFKIPADSPAGGPVMDVSKATSWLSFKQDNSCQPETKNQDRFCPLWFGVGELRSVRVKLRLSQQQRTISNGQRAAGVPLWFRFLCSGSSVSKRYKLHKINKIKKENTLALFGGCGTFGTDKKTHFFFPALFLRKLRRKLMTSSDADATKCVMVRSQVGN